VTDDTPWRFDCHVIPDAEFDSHEQARTCPCGPVLQTRSGDAASDDCEEKIVVVHRPLP